LSDQTPLGPELQATFCSTLVDEWFRAGVRYFVVSPGSRSTPLALAIAGRSDVYLRVVLDERSASFVALGIARATKRAVVLLCTSGTAAVEYHAAVVEADLDHVPLIVCTADRPPELHGIGAPQTVVQHGLYGSATRWSVDPGVADEANRSSWRSVAARTVLAAEHSVRGPGPVHMNLPFREPLVATPLSLPPGRPDGLPWHRTVNASSPMGEAVLQDLLSHVSGRRGVLVIGDGAGSVSAIHRLAEALQWPILADARSGARIDSAHTISYVDLFLRDLSTAEELRPEVVVHMGAPWASKVLGQWLASAPNDVLVDPFDAWLDPNRACALHLNVDPTDLANGLVNAPDLQPATVEWLSRWRTVDDRAASVLDAMTRAGANDTSILEPVLARSLLHSLPDGSHLVVSSSMPVRDVEWFGAARSGVTVHANRGANGIDGVVSTIVGVAIASDGPTYGLLGDLSFLHDASGLVTAATLGVAATLVVVDNAGGGIFEFLSQATTVARSTFESLFGTPQAVDIAGLAAAFGFEVIRVRTVAELCEVVRTPTSRLRLVVANTDRVANVEAHRVLNASVAEALRS
jgi:2-succinyl-5-enolpyruvyl-6-hydroxy-3-cyclohexene-1-carboxylate synthase